MKYDMKSSAIYSESDLKKGKCKCCGEKSDKILIDDGRCADCIEEETFFEQIMSKRIKKASQAPPLNTRSWPV
jgi:predicted ATP-dependent serine protease